MGRVGRGAGAGGDEGGLVLEHEVIKLLLGLLGVWESI